MSIFERLRASEINFLVASFYDLGYVVWLGDDLSGFVDETTCKMMSEVEAWLTAAACRHYPESPFARAATA